MLLLEKNEYSEYDKESVELFLKDNKIKKYLLGRNEYSKELSKLIYIDGFIDDFTEEKEFEGKKIFNLKEIEKESLVVSCSNLRPITSKINIDKSGIRNIDSFLFWKLSEIEMNSMKYMKEQVDDIYRNFEKYEKIYELLEDKESKEIFFNIINFRNSMNIKYLRNFKYKISEQYFEEFLNFDKDEVFVDAGGFDGDTTIKFIENAPFYKSIYFFEPAPENIKIAKENLKLYKNIIFNEIGLSNQKYILKFGSGDGSASKIDKKGNIEIKVDKLDDIVKEKVSFIKMDIEGSEIDAISGAKNHIRNDTPKMAICVYHKKDDLWNIPEKIFEINKNYKIYLRHYTEGIHETVIFFIPRN